MSELEVKASTLQTQLEHLLKSDPATIREIADSVKSTIAKANMWTDNIFILRQFICNKLKIDESMINKEFGIPEDLDLIE